MSHTIEHYGIRFTFNADYSGEIYAFKTFGEPFRLETNLEEIKSIVAGTVDISSYGMPIQAFKNFLFGYNKDRIIRLAENLDSLEDSEKVLSLLESIINERDSIRDRLKSGKF